MTAYTFPVESHETCLFELVTAHRRVNGYPVGGPRGVKLRTPEERDRLRDSLFIGKELADLFGEVIDGHDAVKERLRLANKAREEG